MKRFAIAGLVVASALTLTACGSGSGGYSDGYSSNGGWTDRDWDMNNPSIYNNNTYCHGGTYQPMAGNQFSCLNNGVTTRPSPRPAPVIPPKTQQAAPPAVQQKRQEVQKQAQQQKSAPKPAAPAPKAPAPAPKAPAKTGK